jgi:hypothetical protein
MRRSRASWTTFSDSLSSADVASSRSSWSTRAARQSAAQPGERSKGMQLSQEGRARGLRRGGYRPPLEATGGRASQAERSLRGCRLPPGGRTSPGEGRQLGPGAVLGSTYNAGILEYGPGNGNALLLAPRHLHPALPHLPHAARARQSASSRETGTLQLGKAQGHAPSPQQTWPPTPHCITRSDRPLSGCPARCPPGACPGLTCVL